MRDPLVVADRPVRSTPWVPGCREPPERTLNVAEGAFRLAAGTDLVLGGGWASGRHCRHGHVQRPRGDAAHGGRGRRGGAAGAPPRGAARPRRPGLRACPGAVERGDRQAPRPDRPQAVPGPSGHLRRHRAARAPLPLAVGVPGRPRRPGHRHAPGARLPEPLATVLHDHVPARRRGRPRSRRRHRVPRPVRRLRRERQRRRPPPGVCRAGRLGSRELLPPQPEHIHPSA